MPNVQLKVMKGLSPFRKIALGTWQTTYDPSIYGGMRFRMEKAMDYIAKFRLRYGKKLTVTHLVTKALALALKACPSANAIVRFNRIYLRQAVDVSVLVVITHEDSDRVDLSMAKIRNADEISLLDMVTQLEKRVEKVRTGKDKELEQTRQSMRWIPGFLMNLFLKALSFFMFTLNLNLTWLGLPRDAFGSAIVTNVGSLGLSTAFVPLVPYSRVPIFIAPGEAFDAAVVEDGEVKVGKIMEVNATFDHRLIDGHHAMVMARVFKQILESPFEHLDPVDGEPAEVAGQDADKAAKAAVGDAEEAPEVSAEEADGPAEVAEKS